MLEADGWFLVRTPEDTGQSSAVQTLC